MMVKAFAEVANQKEARIYYDDDCLDTIKRTEAECILKSDFSGASLFRSGGKPGGRRYLACLAFPSEWATEYCTDDELINMGYEKLDGWEPEI